MSGERLSTESGGIDMERVWETLRVLTDTGECWFDHHGGCQEHGFLSLQPGQMCAHAEAKQLLAAHDAQVTPPAQCAAQIATAHPRISQTCALPVLHKGDCSPIYPPASEGGPSDA